MNGLAQAALIVAASLVSGDASGKQDGAVGPEIGKKISKFKLDKIQGQLCWGCFG